MAVREIITVPDPRLKLVSKPVDRVDDDLRELMDDMLQSMYAADGIGLAAIQVGEPKRVIVMDLAKADEAPQPRFFVNPVLSDPSDTLQPYEEGCLSVPTEYLDYDGQRREEIAEGMFAVCIQHEMDHLEGILFIDYLSRLKRQRAVARVKKLEKDKTREDAA